SQVNRTVSLVISSLPLPLVRHDTGQTRTSGTLTGWRRSQRPSTSSEKKISTSGPSSSATPLATSMSAGLPTGSDQITTTQPALISTASVVHSTWLRPRDAAVLAIHANPTLQATTSTATPNQKTMMAVLPP